MNFFLLFLVVIITFIVQANTFLFCFRHYEKIEFKKFVQSMNVEFESLKQLRTSFPEIEPKETKPVKIRNKILNYEYEN
jgi:hypothetical protein